jgi:choline kinase
MNRKRLSEEKHKSIMYNNRAILFYEIKGLSTKIVRVFVCVCVCQAGENRTKYEALQHLFNRST